MQMICCLPESSRSLLPTTSATLPPIPASISSKMKVFSSSPPVIFLMASMILESSPPEATFLSGLKGSPGVRREQELHLVPAVFADPPPVGDLDLELHALHGKEGELSVTSSSIPCRPFPSPRR